ncbi:hypothetical protein TARUN_8370 [Trichoderma arundinaceum]|uniref:Uncharacterized protein n=1 Tax=Trichoderma arundinaceum TaxID=490622 RepID=A0A395ND39_TRIAR|nr:hypothetical protein TARUN_8370 [Trichoderma arundinaceum]
MTGYTRGQAMTSDILKTPRQRQQRSIRAETQSRQQNYRVAAGPEFPAQNAVRRLSNEELAIALVPAIHGDEEDGGAKGGEEGADGVELLGKDLENDEGEGEEAEGCAHVGALKGSLGGADFDESTRAQRSQHHRPGSMEAEMHALLWCQVTPQVMRASLRIQQQHRKGRQPAAAACAEKWRLSIRRRAYLPAAKSKRWWHKASPAAMQDSDAGLWECASGLCTGRRKSTGHFNEQRLTTTSSFVESSASMAAVAKTVMVVILPSKTPTTTEYKGEQTSRREKDDEISSGDLNLSDNASFREQGGVCVSHRMGSTWLRERLGGWHHLTWPSASFWIASQGRHGPFWSLPVDGLEAARSLVPTVPGSACMAWARGQAALDGWVPVPAPRRWADEQYRTIMLSSQCVRLFDPRAGHILDLGIEGRPTERA